MKFKTTQKEIRSNYPTVISVPYCGLQNLLNYESPVAYTVRREGWGAFCAGGGIMASNRIPRHFTRITGEMLIETTETRPGDIIRVYKNDMGYCGYNPRTNRHFYIFVSMLRNAEIFKLQEVLQ